MQVFGNENSSQTNANLHYSSYSYSGLIPNERALSDCLPKSSQQSPLSWLAVFTGSWRFQLQEPCFWVRCWHLDCEQPLFCLEIHKEECKTSEQLSVWLQKWHLLVACGLWIHVSCLHAHCTHDITCDAFYFVFFPMEFRAKERPFTALLTQSPLPPNLHPQLSILIIFIHSNMRWC